MSAPSDDEYFVGYLPTPPRTLRFSIAVLVGSLVLVLGLAAALARGMGGPGRGYGGERADVTGVLSTSPYGILWVADEEDPTQVRALLLVRGWKVGLPASASELDGHVVHAQGYQLERDGVRMLAIGPPLEEGTLAPELEARLRARTTEALGEVTLRGEIVDSKCQLGAMRPGAGRAHRACAQQCIAGGIPPVLVTMDAQGARSYFLLQQEDGSAAGDALLDYVAEPVEVGGALWREGDLVILRVSSISRL